jgi:RNA polymerase sigma-19 factor, ECF subfamily
MTDLELLDRYRIRGDKAALDRLVERYYGFVLRVCRRQLRNEADADDAAQQVFGHLLSHAPAVHSNVAAWLHGCAHNVSVSLVRSRMAQRRTEQAYLERGAHGDKTDADLLIALDECLATMPDRDRELIIQTQLLRVPQRVLAAQRGVSQQAVAKQIARSMDRLRLAISARGFVITAAALAAVLESEASATLITVSAAAATTHLAATTLATATKLKLLGSAIAGLVLLSLPGTVERAPVAAPAAARAAVDRELAPPPPAMLALAPPPVERRLLVEDARDGWLDEPVDDSPRASRRGMIGPRSASRVPSPTTIAPAPPANRSARESEIAEPDPFAPRVAHPGPNWQRWGLSRWSWGVETPVPTPLVASPSPVPPSSVVHNAPATAGPGDVVHLRSAHPNAVPLAKPNPAAMAPAGGSSGGSAAAVQAASHAPAANSSIGKTADVATAAAPNALPSGASPSSAPRLVGAPSNAPPARGSNAGTIHDDAPAHNSAIVISERPDLDAPYADRNIAPRGGPPLEQLAHIDTFVLTLDDGKSMPVIEVPRMVQLSASMPRTASAVIESDRVDSHLAEAILVPLDAHDLVALISESATDQGQASLLARSVAARSGADYGSPGLSPQQLMQIAGDDSHLDGHAGDTQIAMSAYEEFADAVRLPWMDGDTGFVGSRAVDGSAAYAVQLSAVPEPAAWELALGAAGAILLALASQRRSRRLRLADPFGKQLASGVHGTARQGAK